MDGYTCRSMRRFASLVAILLLLSTTAPVLACMTGGGMNARESACCRSMHGHCGTMAKSGCCRTEFRVQQHPQITVRPPCLDLHNVAIDWRTPAFVAVQRVPPFLLKAPDEYSPPGLLTATLTVLRI